MKLSAIRLSEVGRFADPVAIEDLSPGLNVLSGPNEFGKSTIFKALRQLFVVKHTSTQQSVKDLAPYSGGSPLIEADFELDGCNYRLTKRFGRGKQAELRDLDGGRLLARGPDAEEQVDALFGSSENAEHRLGLLWIAQRNALGGPAALDEKKGGSLLLAAIEREIETVAGGPLAQQVRQRVDTALAELVTMTGRPKTGGPLQKALSERDRLQQELAAARQIAEETARQRDELGNLNAEIADLTDPQKRAEADARLDASRQAYAVVRLANEQLATAMARRNAQASVHVAAEQSLAAFVSALEMRSRLRTQQAESDVQLESLVAASSEAANALEACKEEGEGLAQEKQRLSEIALAVEKAASRKLARARLDELRAAHDKAQQLSATAADAEARLRDDPATPECMQQLSEAERAMQLAQGRLDAASPIVEMNYAGDATPRLILDGEAIEPGRALTVRNAASIEIPGIGTLQVRPGGGDDREEQSRQLEEAKQKVDDMLAQLQVASLADARAAFERREKAQRDLEEAATTLRSLAPAGVEALAAQLDELERSATNDDQDADNPEDYADFDDPAELKRQRAELDRKLDSVRKKFSQLQAEDREQAKALERARSETDTRAARLQELEAELGDEATSETRLDALKATVTSAQSDLNALQRDVLALQEQARDGAQLAALKLAIEEAETAVASRDARLQDLRVRVAEIEGHVRASDEAGAGLKVSALAGELERASAEVARLEADVGALRLLKDTLEQSANDVRERFHEPILSRLSPYMSEMFPGSRITFGDRFEPISIERAGITEGIGSLSDGTQEQLAILVRLAFAKALTDSGRGGPVILDDPLAYSDDDRLQAAFEVLRRAAEAHQIIVLTCRAAAFTGLEARRLVLSTWRPEQNALKAAG